MTTIKVQAGGLLRVAINDIFKWCSFLINSLLQLTMFPLVENNRSASTSDLELIVFEILPVSLCNMED